MKPSAEEILQSFYCGFGVQVALYDEQFRCVYSVAEHTPYCSALHRSAGCLEQCIRSDRWAMTQVKQTKSPYIFTCPFGFYGAFFPIYEGKKLLGCLVVGPAIAAEREEAWRAVHERVLADYPELSAEAMEQGAMQLPRLSREQLIAAEQMIAVLAEYLADHGGMLPSEQSRGQLIAQFIRRNLSEKITLAGISRQLNCSTVTLTETFRREFGMTIMEYVRRERMALARELLADTSLSVTEIGTRCGFPDVEYFSRCFKQDEECSPTEWRRMR